MLRQGVWQHIACRNHGIGLRIKMLTALAFIFTLGLIVTIHEYGHFQMAKWCGVKVLKFSVGFGKPLFQTRLGQDQTEFIIAAIPLGGYVKMLGEDSMSDRELRDQDITRALNRQSVGKRMAIVLAGPFANLLLAVMLYCILFLVGVPGLKPMIGGVLENSPAALSQMQAGDVITKVNDTTVSSWQEARWVLLKSSFKQNLIEIETVSPLHETQRYQLDISHLNHDDLSRDVLDQLGLKMYKPQMPARVGSVAFGSPAEAAGLLKGDWVLAVNEQAVGDWNAFVNEVKRSLDAEVRLLIKRGEQTKIVTVRPEAVVENGKTIGRLGVGLQVDEQLLQQTWITTQYTLPEAMLKAVERTWDTAKFSLDMLANMVIGNVSWKGISGPVTIADYAGQSAHMGVKVFLGFIALISISIGVINLLPIPILDGGHFMYYMVEFLTGKPVSETVLSIGQRIGFVIIGGMMILALYNDANRLIAG